MVLDKCTERLSLNALRLIRVAFGKFSTDNLGTGDMVYHPVSNSCSIEACVEGFNVESLIGQLNKPAKWLDRLIGIRLLVEMSVLLYIFGGPKLRLVYWTMVRPT